MSSQRESVEDVLIIGAGPSGLFVASELARHGVRARLIEKELEPHVQSRATGLAPATLEVLQRAGAVEPFLAQAQRLRAMRIVDRALVPAFDRSFDGMDTPYSFVGSLPQCHTEALLEAHLRALGGSVERGRCAEQIDALDDGSRVRVRHADGTVETVVTRYLIGAGGAHGPVRGALHEHLEGTTYPFRYLVADARADLGLPSDVVSVAISAAGMVMMVPLPDDRWLFVIDLPDGDCATVPTLDDLATALARHVDAQPPLSDLRWASLFHTHRRIAPRFGDGHRFLVGDAAHICSPFGGEGMNAGLQDGADLAWKLALACRGLARPLLLDAYAAERHCVAAQVLESADAARNDFYRMIGLVAAGQPITPAPPDETITAPAMLDVSWCDSPIVGTCAEAVAPPDARPGTRFRDRTRLRGTAHHLVVFSDGAERAGPLARFRDRWHRQIDIVDGRSLGADVAERAGLARGGALLVRPDGFIGYCAVPWTAEALAALDTHLAQQLVPQ